MPAKSKTTKGSLGHDSFFNYRLKFSFQKLAGIDAKLNQTLFAQSQGLCHTTGSQESL